jgi:hypothetical protein
LCADWWWKLDTRIKRVGILCPLLVSCVGSRGLSLAAFGVRRVAGCHKWSAVVAVWSFRVDRGGGCRCATVEVGRSLFPDMHIPLFGKLQLEFISFISEHFYLQLI